MLPQPRNQLYFIRVFFVPGTLMGIEFLENTSVTHFQKNSSNFKKKKWQFLSDLFYQICVPLISLRVAQRFAGKVLCLQCLLSHLIPNMLILVTSQNRQQLIQISVWIPDSTMSRFLKLKKKTKVKSTLKESSSMLRCFTSINTTYLLKLGFLPSFISIKWGQPTCNRRASFKDVELDMGANWIRLDL